MRLENITRRNPSPRIQAACIHYRMITCDALLSSQRETPYHLASNVALKSFQLRRVERHTSGRKPIIQHGCVLAFRDPSRSVRPPSYQDKIPVGFAVFVHPLAAPDQSRRPHVPCQPRMRLIHAERVGKIRRCIGVRGYLSLGRPARWGGLNGRKDSLLLRFFFLLVKKR
jgi:hypothetical protein